VDYQRISMRHLAYTGSGQAAVPRAATPRGSGRVCVTWGHTMAKLDPSRFLAGHVLDALAGEPDLEVVAAVSAGQRPLLRAGYPNAEILVDASLDDVLPDCDLVIAHGGAGTVLTAVRHAVPMLLIPQLPDHTGHAARVLAAGAGVVLTRDQATGERIVKETRALLAEGDAPRRALSNLAAQMRRTPSPAEVAERLVSLISDR